MLHRISLALTLMLLVGSGCATAQAPSATEARQPTPGSITRDKPGGDADEPIDAALERLLAEPIGKKVDRWRTIGAKFPDARNWKRVRFWGYPTRAGFRYGKDPHVAVGMLSYTPADGDDSPDACMKAFVKRARTTAEQFDVDVGEARREARTAKAGPESVSWEEAAAEWEIEKKRRIEERKARLAELREKKLERLKKARERWRKRREARKKAAEARKKAAAEAAAKGDASQTIPTSAKTADGEAKPATPAQHVAPRRKVLQRIRRPVPPKKTSAKTDPPKQAKPKKAAPPSKPETEEQKKRASERLKLREEQRSLISGQPRKYRRVPLPKHLPASEMLVMRSSGEFNTLFKRDHYEVAVVAYDSWPGTCLVQGFAVRVGSDLMLARRVVTRWVDEAAPILHWASWLREAPPFNNR